MGSGEFSTRGPTVTPDELRVLVNQYRAGLEAEMALLHQLDTLAARQRELTTAADLTGVPDVVDARDRVMANLVAIEHQLKPIRAALADHRAALTHLPDYEDLAEHHREASALVSSILATDHESMDALREAEQARRKDPVKRTMQGGVALVALALCCVGLVQFKMRRAGTELSELESKWKAIASDYAELEKKLKKSVDLEIRLGQLQSMATNRFLVGSMLDAVQYAVLPDINIVRLKTDQSFVTEQPPHRKAFGDFP